MSRPIALRKADDPQGFNEEIDRLRDLASGGKGKIAEIEQAERERTGISKLEIGYNRVFGYYIEVSRSNAEAVPENYIRKQTLANSERYITEELKQLEEHRARCAGTPDRSRVRGIRFCTRPDCRRGTPRAEDRAGYRSA